MRKVYLVMVQRRDEELKYAEVAGGRPFVTHNKSRARAEVTHLRKLRLVEDAWVVVVTDTQSIPQKDSKKC